MRNKIFGRQLKRDTNERKALFKGLMTALVLMESITTTHQKAQAIQGSVEKLVTKAKKKGEASKREMGMYLTNDAIEKMVGDIAGRFSTRPGGYTRIIKTQRRLSDKAQMAIIEWVEKGKGLVVTGKEVVVTETKDAKVAPKKEKPAKKIAKVVKSKTVKTKEGKK